MKRTRKSGSWRYWIYGAMVLAAALAWSVLAEPVLPRRPGADIPEVSPARLEAHVRMLSETFVPRDFQSVQNLHRSADYIAGQFEAAGAKVERQPFTVMGNAYENVIAHFGPDEGAHVILGAHYDSFGKLPAADDNASGVAALIELGGLLGKFTPTKPVDLVAYSLEEPPYFSSANMGSAFHAADLRKRGVPVDFMASVEMVGCFKDEPGSQEPQGAIFRTLVPSRGDFIAVVGRLSDIPLVRRVKSGMRMGSDLPISSLNAPPSVGGIDLSDHLNYWKEGFPAVMITDTAFMRNDNYHTAEDTAEKLDYRRMAKVVQDLFALVKGA
jgi:hypothetical protein